MTDREMLELAAKAAGMRVRCDGVPWPREPIGWFFNQVGGNPPALYDAGSRALTMWAPLTDDGDALRLAVACHIDIRHFMYEQGRMDCLVDRLGRGFREELNDDPCAATRRAIVRAAAEIGKEMP